jgi:dipeptidyl aminopeptidase/acylaminoacyl peptidase
MKILSLALALLATQATAPAAPPAPPPAAPAGAMAPPATATPAPTGVAGMAQVSGRPNLLQVGVPAVPEELWQRAERLLEARSARFLDVSASGDEVLIATRFGQSSQLHVVDRPMGARTQITFGREPVSQGAFLPGDPMVVYFLRDVGGAENWQVFRLDRRTGKTERITDGKSRHESLVLSPDGRMLAYGSTARNGKDTDVVVATTARPAEGRILFEEPGTWYPVDFSADGRQLLVRRYRSIADSDLFLVDATTGARRALTPAEGKASVGASRFSADGKSVYFVSDRQGDYDELYRLDLADASATARPLTRNLRWDVEGLAVARDGGRIAVTVNADGASRLYFLEPRSGKLAPGDLPQGVASTLRFPAGRPSSLFLGLVTPVSPGDVWQVTPGKKTPARWTRSEIGGIDPATLVEPILVRYPAADGVSIPAWLYLPKAGGKHPVVISWHGGPEAQERPTFQPLAQLLVQGGLAVLLPNVRGSAGYGKAYLAMDDGVKRERALGDIGATLDYVASRADLDPARVGVFGGSYGGYMVLATAAFYPARIRSAVDIVGISSLPTFLESTAPYRRDLRRAEYGDERDPAVRAVQERISPLYHVASISAALYVIQGKNDPRVPQSEAEQIVSAVRGKGKDVWYLLALDEGHGFQKKENRDYALVTTIAFFERTLTQ